METGERRAADTWYRVLGTWYLVPATLATLGSRLFFLQRRPAQPHPFPFCCPHILRLHRQPQRAALSNMFALLHAPCCMLHAPACCSCYSLSVAEQPWGSLGRLSRHRVIAHCTNLLCNKFPVLTASTLPLPLLLRHPPLASTPAAACVPAPLVF